MIKKIISIGLFVAFVTIFHSNNALAQAVPVKQADTINTPLLLGEPAIPIKAAYWIKGKPITKFEKGKVYVLDFWATWCKYCIASMPHMSELNTRYEGKVEFIGVDVKEPAPKGTDPVSHNKSRVIEFVKNGPGKAMNFASFSDTPDDYMFNNWVSGQQWLGSFGKGIPFTVIINQQGIVAWVGFGTDYTSLDKALDEIVNGKFSVAEFKQYCLNLPAERARIAAEKAALRIKLENDPELLPVSKAAEAKDYPLALDLVYQLIMRRPELKSVTYIRRVGYFRELLNLHPELLIALARKYEAPLSDSLLRENIPSVWMSIGTLIAAKKDLSPELYLFAIDALQGIYKSSAPNSRNVEALARLYYMTGDKDKAIGVLQMMIDRGKAYNSEDTYFVKLKQEFEGGKFK